MNIFDKHQARKAEVLPPAKEPERVFHNTVPLLDDLALLQSTEKAIRQKDKILTIFRQNPLLWLTSYQVQDLYVELFGPILITSVRRSLTDLTKEGTGRLRKSLPEGQVKERWGTNNNRWQFNSEFLPSLNPKK